MKILHTADWHIGKVLHKHSLRDEMLMFLDWLLEMMAAEDVDVLLISGDIFDVANPGVKDRQLYYKFLSRLIGRDVQVIITGGNHDSVAFLEAPQEILAHLDITVIGGARDLIEEELVAVKNRLGEVALVVAAVPFLRDRDLRTYQMDGSVDRVEAIRHGIGMHYQDLAEACRSVYPSVPALAMGHLYARGASVSESERDIHIGNAAAVESTVFTDYFGYVALGHIHRPQRIGGDDMVRYSGSPIALSFSEREDRKCVLLIDLVDNAFSTPTIVEVPKFRELRRFTGTFAEVDSALSKYVPVFPLRSFVEVEVTEDLFSAATLSAVDSLVTSDHTDDNYSILKARTHFLTGAKDTSDLFEYGTNIEDLRPIDVFKQKVDRQNLDETTQKSLYDTFQELLEYVQEGAED